MKNRSEKKYLFPTLLFSILLIACSSLGHYDELLEIDLFSFQHAFENPDVKGLASDKQNLPIIFVNSTSPEICFSSFFFINPLPHSFPSILSSFQPISILRC